MGFQQFSCFVEVLDTLEMMLPADAAPHGACQADCDAHNRRTRLRCHRHAGKHLFTSPSGCYFAGNWAEWQIRLDLGNQIQMPRFDCLDTGNRHFQFFFRDLAFMGLGG
jgi:hypothetical protein